MLPEIIYFSVVLVSALVCILAAILSLVQKPTWVAGIGALVAIGMVVGSVLFLLQGYHGCHP